MTKMKKRYPHYSRGQNQSKPEVEVNLKENLKVTDKTHRKTKRQMKYTLTKILITIIIMIIILPKVKTEAADLLTAKAVIDNSEASHREAEAKDLSTIRTNFRTIDFREAHIRVATMNLAANANLISREINEIPIEDKAMAGVLNK